MTRPDCRFSLPGPRVLIETPRNPSPWPFFWGLAFGGVVSLVGVAVLLGYVLLGCFLALGIVVGALLWAFESSLPAPPEGYRRTTKGDE